MLNLVDVQGDEEGREGGADREVLLLEMLADVRVVLLERVVQDVDYFHELGHFLHVDAAPLVAVEDEDEAPEDFLFVLDVHEEHGCDVVEALDVADLCVVVGVG